MLHLLKHHSYSCKNLVKEFRTDYRSNFYDNFFLKMQIKLAGTISLKLKFVHLRGCINIPNCPMFTSQKFISQSGHCQALASLYVNALSSPAVCHFCLHLSPSVVINLPVCIQRCKTVFWSPSLPIVSANRLYIALGPGHFNFVSSICHIQSLTLHDWLSHKSQKSH